MSESTRNTTPNNTCFLSALADATKQLAKPLTNQFKNLDPAIKAEIDRVLDAMGQASVVAVKHYTGVDLVDSDKDTDQVDRDTFKIDGSASSEQIKQAIYFFESLDVERPEPNAQTDLKELGQWVFEGKDPKWVGGAVDGNGEGFLYTSNNGVTNRRPKLFKDGIDAVVWDNLDKRWLPENGVGSRFVGYGFAASRAHDSFIVREPVNDVEFDSDERADFEAQVAPDNSFEIIADDHDLTTADLSRIFIQNLCAVLIHRMYTLARFSGSDAFISNDKLQPWDIVVFEVDDRDKIQIAIIKDQTDKEWYLGFNPRTILESEIEAFFKSMEARYVDQDGK